MEQSEYLKNLMKRLDEISQPYHDLHDTTNPHSISTIKFERDEFDTNFIISKRGSPQNAQNNSQAHTNQVREESERDKGVHLANMIDNSKTSRNSPGLKFNPAKVRKRSEDKFDRQLMSKRSSSTKKDKQQLVAVRDKLIDLVSYLNTKIEGNPEVAVKKVIDLDYVKESLLPKQANYRPQSKRDFHQKSNHQNLLYLPKFQLHDAKLVKSSEILNNYSQDNNKMDSQFLNLKHSFDKLNDIHSTQSLHQHQHLHRQNPPIPQEHPKRQREQPRLNRFIPQSNQRPIIYINGRPNNNSQLNIAPPPLPAVKQIRPYSEVPVVRYVQYSQIDPNSVHTSNSLSKISINKQPQPPPPYHLPIGQQTRPYPLNLGRPPTFRTITARPLSTQRLPSPPQQHRITSPNPQNRPILPQTQNIPPQRIKQYEPPQNARIRTEQAAQSSRLKKKQNLNQYFKDPHGEVDTPKRLLTQLQEDNREQFSKQAEQELQKIAPPKPYTNFSSTLDNPFKISQPALSLSKKSSRFKADIAHDILKSIAQQSQENQPSRNLEASGRSSGRMMSSVHQLLPAADFPTLNKFSGSGSTKLKRKGIDISSSKKGYMSQYTRQ